jgi:hypothetical protein
VVVAPDLREPARKAAIAARIYLEIALALVRGVQVRLVNAVLRGVQL